MITRTGLEAAFFLVLILYFFLAVPEDRLVNWYFNEHAQFPTSVSTGSDTGLIDGAINWVMEHAFVPVWNAFFANDGFRLLVAPIGLVALVGVLLGDFIHGFKGRDDAAK